MGLGEGDMKRTSRAELHRAWIEKITHAVEQRRVERQRAEVEKITAAIEVHDSLRRAAPHMIITTPYSRSLWKHAKGNTWEYVCRDREGPLLDVPSFEVGEIVAMSFLDEKAWDYALTQRGADDLFPETDDETDDAWDRFVGTCQEEEET